MSEAGKGDDRRPREITQDEWDRRFAQSFGNTQTEEDDDS